MGHTQLKMTTSPCFVTALPVRKRIPKSQGQVCSISRLKPRCSAALPSVIDPKLAKAAVGATSKLLTTTLLGFLAAKRNVLDKTCIRALAKTVFNIFLPSILFCNVLSTMVSGAGSQLIALPLVALMFVGVGLLSGLVLCRILGLTGVENQRLMLVCCGFNNSAALPLLFCNALFAYGSEQLVAMTAGISFYLLVWTPLFWTGAGYLLSTIPSDDPNDKSNENRSSMLSTILEKLRSPPLIASLAGVLFGCAPSWITAAFMNSPVFAALRTLGTGYGPAAVLVLAGSLAGGSNSGGTAKKSHSMPLGRMTLGICLTRYVLMPLFALLLVKIGVGNKLCLLPILIESTMPPAQNGTVILQLEGKSELAQRLATVLAIVYLLGIPLIVVWLSLFLGIAGITPV